MELELVYLSIRSKRLGKRNGWVLYRKRRALLAGGVGDGCWGGTCKCVLEVFSFAATMLDTRDCWLNKPPALVKQAIDHGDSVVAHGDSVVAHDSLQYSSQRTLSIFSKSSLR